MKCPCCGNEANFDQTEMDLINFMTQAARCGDNDLAQEYAMQLKSYRDNYKIEH